jgi:type IV secretion system protein VirB4
VGEASSLQMSPVDLVADAAWFAQMPGNWQWRPRDAKLSSRAFAALASGHNFARGKRDGNPWGEALALLRTPSGQPFYLNLHSSPEGEDSGDKKLPGNTLIIGSTGVGKTTLEMFLLTLTRKWDPAPRSPSARWAAGTSRWKQASPPAATRYSVSRRRPASSSGSS